MPTDENRRFNLTPFIGIVFAAALLLLVGYSLLASRWGTIAVGPVDVGPATDLQTAVVEMPDDVMRSVEAQREVVAKVQLQRVRDRGEELLATITQLEREQEAWQKDTDELLHGDAGRWIAADFELAKRFAALIEEDRPDVEYAVRQRARVRTLLTPIHDALAGRIALFTPDDSTQQQLDIESEPTQRQLAATQAARKRLSALLAEAHEIGDAPASQPLANALEQVEAHYARLRAEELARVRDEVEAENRQKMAELERRKLAELATAERERREAELEGRRRSEETQARLAREKAQKDILRKRARSAEVQARYQVFLAKGRFSLSSERVLNTPSFHLSYNALKQAGVLSELKQFLRAATGRNASRPPPAGPGMYKKTPIPFSLNDRPLWPDYPQTDDEWQTAGERFEEFCELAPFWREMGLLRP